MHILFELFEGFIVSIVSFTIDFFSGIDLLDVFTHIHLN